MKRGPKFKKEQLDFMKIYNLHYNDHTINAPRRGIPNFGNEFRPLLKGGGAGLRSRPPNYENLCIHFGYYQSVYFRERADEASGNPLTIAEQRALKKDKKESFIGTCVVPTRRWLNSDDCPIGCWLYTVPSEDQIFKQNPGTGLLQWQFDFTQRVLAVLPQTVEIARTKYNLPDSELEMLAPQVGWLLITFCRRPISRFLMRTEASDALGGWKDFLSSDQNDHYTECIHRAIPHQIIQVIHHLP